MDQESTETILGEELAKRFLGIAHHRSKLATLLQETSTKMKGGDINEATFMDPAITRCLFMLDSLAETPKGGHEKSPWFDQDSHTNTINKNNKQDKTCACACSC